MHFCNQHCKNVVAKKVSERVQNNSLRYLLKSSVEQMVRTPIAQVSVVGYDTVSLTEGGCHGD